MIKPSTEAPSCISFVSKAFTARISIMRGFGIMHKAINTKRINLTFRHSYKCHLREHKMPSRCQKITIICRVSHPLLEAKTLPIRKYVWGGQNLVKIEFLLLLIFQIAAPPRLLTKRTRDGGGGGHEHRKILIHSYVIVLRNLANWRIK